MEVDIVPFEEAMPDDILELVKNPPQPPPLEDLEAQVKGLFEVFLEVIEMSWDPNKFHFVYHSSGWDSRWMSWAIRHLHEKNGSDWLGSILFIEYLCESEPLKQIMEVEGWTNSQWAVYRPETQGTGEYHAPSLEFSSAWKRLNGCAPVPLALFYDPVVYFQDKGLAPNDDQLQCWTGLFANELPCLTGEYGFETAVRRLMGNSYCTHLQKGDLILPYLNLKWVAAKLGSSQGATRFQKEIVETIAPQLTHIPRISGPTTKKGPCCRISKGLLKKVIHDYDSSWFGREIQPGVRPRRALICAVEQWWGCWALASLCEHLLEQGHTIKLQE